MFLKHFGENVPLYYITNGTTHNLYEGGPQAITVFYIYIKFFERLLNFTPQ